MKEFNNMTRDQQIEALAWEVEHHEQGIGYLQDLLEKELKTQKWLFSKNSKKWPVYVVEIAGT